MNEQGPGGQKEWEEERNLLQNQIQELKKQNYDSSKDLKKAQEERDEAIDKIQDMQ